MSRLGDLIRFYDLLDRLEQHSGGKRIFDDCSGRDNWPDRGVYFFFENGERRSDTGCGPRVVRVGTHALNSRSKSTLWGRLRQHRGGARSGGGNHRTSVFRLLVGTAIATIDPELAIPSWGQRKLKSSEIRSAERDLELRVSDVVRQMRVLWITIEDEPGPDSRRGYIERNTIALLSNYDHSNIDAPSETWLGRHCDRERVRRSGLWNWRHVDENYDPDFLEEFERLVDASA